MNSPQGKLTRRSFLKTTAALAGAATLAGGTGLTALADTAGEAPAEEQVFYSTCRGNCGSRCPQKVVVRDGKVVSTSAAMLEEQDNLNERRICVKGLAQPQRVYDVDRVKYPMKRVEGTERGAGQWERISWDEALDLVAEKMQAAFEQYGPSSVALWNCYASTGLINGSGTGSVAYGRFLSRTGATILGPGADWAQMYMYYTGQLGFVFGNAGTDVPNAKTVMVWGASPTDAYPQDWQFVCRARENGTQLITIDPQFTPAAAHSDLYVPIRPGTDGALMLAMANYIMDNGYVNEAYAKSTTVCPLLVKEDGMYLHLSDLGVAPAEGAPSPYVVWDNATGTYAAANEAADPALYGEYEAEGLKVKTALTTTLEKITDFTLEKAAEICDITVEQAEKVAYAWAAEGPVYVHTNQGLGHHANSHHNYKNLMLLCALTGNLGVPGGSLGHAALGYRSFPYDGSFFSAGTAANFSVCGMYLPEIMADKKFGETPLDIRFLWIANGNPLNTESGRLELIEAVKQVDFVVTLDCTMTDSADYSDLVLPIPHVYETEDCANMPFVPYFPFEPQMIEPLYECRSDFEILKGISERVAGLEDLYDRSAAEYLKAMLDTEANIANGAGYDDIKAKGLVRLYDTSSVTEIDYSFLGHATGRLAFYNDAPFVRCNYGQEIADYEKHPYYEHANESYWENPLREKYPLFGMNQHEKYHVHSQLAYTPWLREIEPEPFIKLNAKDAAERGIAQGDYVRIFNDHGHAVLKARVTEGIKPGVVSIPHGWHTSQFIEGQVQDLTNRFMNDYCSNSAFNDFLCEVEKYEGSVE